MYLKSAFKSLLLLLVIWQLSGCVTYPQQHDYSALIEAKPRSIVVIPPRNDSVEIDASYTFLSTISQPLAEKGYYVFPVAVIDMFMKENGLPTPAEMNSVPLAKIRENIGADAVLYVHIKNWGQKYQLVSSTTVISAVMNLVDARSGQLLWSTSVEERYNPQNSQAQSGLGLIVGALVQQISASITDNTYELSRSASNKAINDPTRGLLQGPYRYELVDEAQATGPKQP